MKWTWRVLHTLAVVATGLGALIALGVMAVSIVVMHFEGRTMAGYEPWFSVFGLSALLVLGLCVVAIVLCVKWRWIAVGGAGVMGVFCFLAYDVAPPPKADLGPRVGEDDLGYQTIMWLSEKSPHSRLKEAGALDWDNREFYWPSKREAWTEHLAKNREAILTAWETDKIGREWVEAISTTPPQGVWSSGLDGPILSLKAVRVVSGVRMTRGLVLAQEGRRDEALVSVTALIRAMHVIQRTSAGLVHEMIASMVLKQCYALCEEILAMGPVSDAAREGLLAALREASSAKQVIRHALLGEQDFVREVFEALHTRRGSLFADVKGGRWLDLGFRFGGRWILFNPNRSEQQVVWKLNRACEQGVARELDKMRETLGEWDYSSPFKNPAGRLMAYGITPAYTKAVEGFWAAEDLRVALIAKLEAR